MVLRTCYEPEETEEFETAKDLLIRRCLTWAEEHGRPADGFMLSAAIDSRHQSRDGRLSHWNADQIRRFLLQWIPRHVVAPRDRLDAAPETLRTLLAYLAATGLRDPRGATPAEADAAIDEAAYQEALDDPYRQSLAKYWAQMALDHGVDPASPKDFDRFRRDIDAGRIQYDQDLLDHLVQARFTEAETLAEERAFAQPPIALPPAAELTEAAARSEIVRQLTALADWVGADGRPLTEAGNLRVADARELAILLATGEEQLQIRSATELPRLTLLLTWAKKLRLLRTSKGRLLRVAKAAPLLRDPEALWRRAFETLFDLGQVITPPATTWQPRSMLTDAFDEILPDVLNSMYGLGTMPMIRLEESVWLACQEYFVFDPAKDERQVDLWRRVVGRDLERTFEILSALGAVELTRGPADELFSSDLDEVDQPLPPDAVERLRTRLAEPDLLLVRLTPLGLRAVRDRLLAEGRDAPLIGEMSTAPPAELLGVLAQHYDPESTVTELEGWLSHPGQDLAALVQSIRDCPFRTRAAAMLATLIEALPDGHSLLRDLRHDPVLGPVALSYLVDGGELAPESLSEREHLLFGAESFLVLLELGGPEAVIEQLREMAGKNAYGIVEALLSSGHGDTTGLAELRTLVAEPLRATRTHPLRLAPTAAPGARGRRKSSDKKWKR
ncbi:hypothetical protein ABGB18_26790 [Nonomuraea sp. B12E4]|uniref:hypothetical protein n=1 Tax=Nonomuraea sp. B12E4 TaxID=3153564 RepID=UPI00325DB7B9